MSQITVRLAELGIEIPEVNKPVAAYQPAVQSGNYVYTAGQLPFIDGALEAVGKVGDTPGAVSQAVATSCARTCVLNGLAAIQSVVGSLDRIARIVKVTGFVASDPEFIAQPLVLNGASELLVDIFGDAGKHARSAVGVSALPLDAPVEVELIVELRD